MAGAISLRYFNNLPNDTSTIRNVRIDDDLVVKSIDWFLTTYGGTGDPNQTGNTGKWYTPEGMSFKEWNTFEDGTGTTYAVGATVPYDIGALYAIWEEISIDYLTTNQELTSIANAIRTKGGTSASLVYPTGFVSAINAISTGTDVSDTTATASDVRTGKYFYTSAGVKTQGSIANGSATTPATTATATVSISLNSSTGVITATASGTKSVTPTVSAGYVSSGTAGTITINGSNTQTIPTWSGGSYGGSSLTSDLVDSGGADYAVLNS